MNQDYYKNKYLLQSVKTDCNKFTFPLFKFYIELKYIAVWFNPTRAFIF